MLIFNNVKFDDYTKNDDSSYWSQICPQCAKKHSINPKYLDDSGSGICGVYGCECNSDDIVYIDFPKGIKEEKENA